MIYRLAKDIEVNRSHWLCLKEKEQQLRSKLEKTTSSLKDVIVSGSRKSTFDITLQKITDIENEIKELDYEHQVLLGEKTRLLGILKGFNDKDQLIYADYKLNRYNTTKIQMKYGISRATVYNIIKRMENELK